MPDLAQNVSLRQRPGDQALPRAGQQDVSEALCRYLTTWADSNAVAHSSSVKADLEARIQLGVQRYGQRLQSHNGRDALRDMYEELLDAAHYAQQLLLEGAEPRGLMRLAFGSTVSLVFDVKALLVARDSASEGP